MQPAIGDQEAKRIWELGSSWGFTNEQSYELKKVTNPLFSKTIWKPKVPKKIKIFL